MATRLPLNAEPAVPAHHVVVKFGAGVPADAQGRALLAQAGAAADDDGEPVGYWTARAGTSPIRGTAGSRPVIKLDIQNGLPVVRSDGTDDEMFLTGLTQASGPRTAFAAFNPGDLSATSLKYLFDSAAGRLILAAATDVGGQVGWFDGAWKKPGTPAAATGFQVMCWSLGAGTGEMFRNGSSIGTAAYTNVAIGGAVGLFATSDGTSNHLACDLGEFLIYTGALSVGNRGSVTNYPKDKWGVA